MTGLVRLYARPMIHTSVLSLKKSKFVSGESHSSFAIVSSVAFISLLYI